MTRVLLLTTGGTIASRRGDQGLEPQISARGLLEYMSDLRAHYHIDARDILNLDSSNIQAEEWQTIARAVMENLDAYDGIVITHGTDTMAYTASGAELHAPESHQTRSPHRLPDAHRQPAHRRPQQPLYRLFRRGLPHPRRLHCL